MLAGLACLLLSVTDVRVDAPSRDAARALARENMTVYDVRDQSAYAYAPDETIAALRQRGYRVTPLPRRPSRQSLGYKSPEEINDALRMIAASNPDVVRLELLGHSVRGVALLGVRIGDGSG